MAVFFFSGCSIRKVEEEKAPETKKQNEVINIDSDGDGLSDEEEKKFRTLDRCKALKLGDEIAGRKIIDIDALDGYKLFFENGWIIKKRG